MLLKKVRGEKAIQNTLHIPVLLEETLELLDLSSGETALDATLGGGGHMREILHKVGETGKVFAIDTDQEAIARVKGEGQKDTGIKTALEAGRLVLLKGNYSALEKLLQEQGVEKVDAILADLGFSSDQIEDADRGLSFLREGALDMRLDQSTGESAKEFLARVSESELTKILWEYGEEKESARIARAIVRTRAEKPLETTTQLASLVEAVYPKGKRRLLSIHPATKTFQALRIVVNQEFRHLETFLGASLEHLTKGGRLAVITFHSGEDRIVKHFFQEAATGCVCPKGFPVCLCKREPKARVLTKKPVVPSEEEIVSNPRARSAKLRVIEKI